MALQRPVMVMIVLVLLVSACSSPAGSSISLAGSGWVVSAIRGTPTLPDHRPTISFDAATTSGTTGCNRFTGGYTLTGNGLTFSQLASTAMACSPAAVMHQESSFSAAMAQVSRVEQRGVGLVLKDSAGATLLVLDPQPTAVPSVRPGVDGSWRLTTITNGGTSVSPVAGSTVTVTLDPAHGSYSGRACNTFGGDLTVSGTAITFGAPHSTKMACVPSSLSVQEATVLSLLPQLTSWQIVDGRLRLQAGNGAGMEFETA